MARGLLVVRSNHDVPTRYASVYLSKVINLANLFGYRIVDLKNELATRDLFVKYVSATNPDIIILAGHGHEDSVNGWREETILKAGVDDRLLEGKVIVGLTCLAGRKLGYTLVSRGAKAFIGFKEPFSFFFNIDSLGPTYDELAKIFFKPSIEATKKLIVGGSLKDAMNIAIKTYNDLIEENKDSPKVVELLKENRNALVGYTHSEDVDKPLVVPILTPKIPLKQENFLNATKQMQLK
ncbi:MAG: hypothetical protein ACTSX6_00140 [Candidatus Heimdallarchaeaceae archaeon]